eukprot:TRINITY_DN5671_c0_g1_i1.p2 TRINITY_DN5671_c0_g1~~TRINITY_DN5671_c0_g1_i1.p2  ORF type:complete len:196 (-),score=54.44 TRINITY_DN5671_c0_g1_i1:28-615(-)
MEDRSAPQVVSWQYTEWPPETRTQGMGVIVEGTVVRTHRVDVKRPGAGGGYLRMQKMDDREWRGLAVTIHVSAAYRRVSQVSSDKGQQLSVENVYSVCGDHVQCPTKGHVCLWGPHTLAGDKKVKAGDVVCITSKGDGPMMDRLDVVTSAPKDMNTNFFKQAHVTSSFDQAIMAQKEKGNAQGQEKEEEEDDWSD